MDKSDVAFCLGLHDEVMPYWCSISAIFRLMSGQEVRLRDLDRDGVQGSAVALRGLGECWASWSPCPPLWIGPAAWTSEHHATPC